MKKYFLPMIMFFALAMSCSSDDDTGITEQEESQNQGDDNGDLGTAIIRIAQVNAVEDEVVLTNLGDGALEIGSYFMCLGPGTYAQVSGLTTEDTNLAPNESITLAYDMNPNADGLSVFTTNSFDSVDPTVLIDYVQWGAENQARVDQAVIAGVWDDALNYVVGASPYVFTGSATQFGFDFWEGSEISDGVVRILTVDTDTDEVTLTNLGGLSIDVGDYFLCLGPGTYMQISAVTDESTVLASGGTIVLSYDMNPAQDGLSIFANTTFGSSDPAILLDYVQWGAGNQARVDQAVAAGRWGDVNNFVPEGSPYNYTGGSEDVGVIFW